MKTFGTWFLAGTFFLISLSGCAPSIVRTSADPGNTPLLLRVLRDGTVKQEGSVIAPKGYELGVLEEFFNSYRDTAGKDGKITLMIKAERTVPFEHVQRVLMVAARAGVDVKVRFAAKE